VRTWLLAEQDYAAQVIAARPTGKTHGAASSTSSCHAGSAPEQAEHKQAEQIRAENCRRARDNLTALQNHGRVSIKEGDTYRALSEEERQAKVSETEGKVAQFCQEVADGK
jgi:hypothetical protein